MFRQKWFISLLCILGFAIPSYAIDGVDEDIADVVSVTTLRYWIDSGTNDMHEQTLENGTSISEVLKQSIDVSDMALGSHTISFQLKGNDEVYKAADPQPGFSGYACSGKPAASGRSPAPPVSLNHLHNKELTAA